jgi:hypothetical protein
MNFTFKVSSCGKRVKKLGGCNWLGFTSTLQQGWQVFCLVIRGVRPDFLILKIRRKASLQWKFTGK